VSAKTHPRAVGAFVLGAIALVLGAIVFLSSAGWLQKRERFSVYFPGSVRGLNPGAPVTFRGIKIGEVDEVKAVLTGKPDPLIQIEVVLEFIGNIVEVPPGLQRPFVGLSSADYAKALIERGIRGKLQSQSLLTGQKYVDFDFLPDEPARLSGLNPRYPELPTTPTAMEKLGERGERFFAKLAELPVDQMLEDIRQALQSLRTLLESEDLKGAISGSRRAASAVPPTLEEVRVTLAEVRKTLDAVAGETRETASAARDTFHEAREALARAERTLARLEETASGADEARVTVTQAIEELRQTLQALRNLVDYVQTHPEAVVLGKPAEKERR
jgi:paraquat-inducible protein B